MTQQQVQNYLKRIEISEAPQVSVEALKQLQLQHLLHVPFENLDIHLNKKVELDVDAFYRKIVDEKRGGFCYELNGVFNELLRAMGFDTKLVSCRPYNASTKTFNEEFDHLAIIVSHDGNQLLTDVGFGDFSIQPLQVGDGLVQNDGRHRFRVGRADEAYLVQHHANAGWANEYLFTTEEHQLSEFADRCTYHQTSGQSHFTQNKVCSRLTPDGRITLTGTKLMLTGSNGIIEVEVADDTEFKKHLSHYFSIHL